jgi:uncharacterized membrane protein YtjA (UPF0391 family)
MLGWAIAFLVVVALIAGALGSGVLAGTAFAAAKIMFVLGLACLLHFCPCRGHPPRSAVTRGLVWLHCK